MAKLQCGYCLKHVRDKPIFGTLHVCKTPAEIEQILVGRRMMEAQRTSWPIAGTLYAGLTYADQAKDRA